MMGAWPIDDQKLFYMLLHTRTFLPNCPFHYSEKKNQWEISLSNKSKGLSIYISLSVIMIILRGLSQWTVVNRWPKQNNIYIFLGVYPIDSFEDSILYKESQKIERICSFTWGYSGKEKIYSRIFWASKSTSYRNFNEIVWMRRLRSTLVTYLPKFIYPSIHPFDTKFGTSSAHFAASI